MIEYVYDDQYGINILRLDLKIMFIELNYKIYIRLFDFKPDHELALWLTTAHPWLIEHVTNYRCFRYMKEWLLFEDGQWINIFKPKPPSKYIIPKACWNLPSLSDEEYFRRFESDVEIPSSKRG